MMKKTRDILKDTSHPLHEFYYVAQSGCRYISERTRTNRYGNTFLPTSVRLNMKSGRGKGLGRMGGYNGAFLQLCNVTTNCHYYCCCVMLCYVNIYHKNFLFRGLLKVIVLSCLVLYCIVLYCIVLYCIVSEKNLPR